MSWRFVTADNLSFIFSFSDACLLARWCGELGQLLPIGPTNLLSSRHKLEKLHHRNEYLTPYAKDCSALKWLICPIFKITVCLSQLALHHTIPKTGSFSFLVTGPTHSLVFEWRRVFYYLFGPSSNQQSLAKLEATRDDRDHGCLHSETPLVVNPVKAPQNVTGHTGIPAPNDPTSEVSVVVPGSSTVQGTNGPSSLYRNVLVYFRRNRMPKIVHSCQNHLTIHNKNKNKCNCNHVKSTRE